MKKILIITPHYPPSNLAAVHRSRLFAQHLPSFGWDPVILTVHEDYYEETLDWNLHRLLPEDQKIEKSKAFPVTKPRLIGDIGLRAFFQLYRRAKQLISGGKVDFLYIPIPSFYGALLGRWLHEATGIKYGIDYIDPWVHHFPGSDKKFSRYWWSTQLARFLEPIAVKKAVLITGVAEGYYKGVQERNPHLQQQAVFGAMPYGGEARDHEMLRQLQLKPYLFNKNTEKIQLVYAGAMLPKAYQPLEAIFSAVSRNRQHFEQMELHFIGTGKSPNDRNGYNIKPLAEQYGLWKTIVHEYPQRIPYLDALVHLDSADGVFILGSTEPHYTPSKTYQGVLSGKPILAVLHEQSTAVQILRNAKGGTVLSFSGEQGVPEIGQTFPLIWTEYLDFLKQFNPDKVDMTSFEEYSAAAVTKKLADLLNTVSR